MPALRIWKDFIMRCRVLEDAVPLFAVEGGNMVKHRGVGKLAQRQVLQRSEEMNELIRREVEKLTDDWSSSVRRLDGLIYMAGVKRDGTFVPLYIGKTETVGRGGGLSANIQRLKKDTSKFARWGDNYAYHMGDLSACVLHGHPEERRTKKYDAWAKAMFAEVPSETPVLREPVFFWTKAWDRNDDGVWRDLGPTRLTFLEYLLIGIGSMCFEQLLNREGLARVAVPAPERSVAALS